MASSQNRTQGRVAPHGLFARAVTTTPEMSFIRLVSKVAGTHLTNQKSVEIIRSAAEAMEAHGIEIFSREVTHALLIVSCYIKPAWQI